MSHGLSFVKRSLMPWVVVIPKEGWTGTQDIRLRLINSLFLMAGLVGFRLIFKNKKKCFLTYWQFVFYGAIVFFPGGRVGFTMSKSRETINLLVPALGTFSRNATHMLLFFPFSYKFDFLSDSAPMVLTPYHWDCDCIHDNRYTAINIMVYMYVFNFLKEQTWLDAKPWGLGNWFGLENSWTCTSLVSIDRHYVRTTALMFWTDTGFTTCISPDIFGFEYVPYFFLDQIGLRVPATPYIYSNIVMWSNIHIKIALSVD